MRMMKRQGDLLIISVGAIPEDARRLEHRVLAEGEATGHKHELESGILYEKNGALYFQVEEPKTVLKHEEHGPLEFESGIYQVIRQREYDPRRFRNVSD